MTLAEIRQEVVERLYDTGFVQFDTDNLNDSIFDGYQEVALLTGCIEKVQTVNFVGQLTYYKMTDYISDYFRPLGIWNVDTNRWLEPVTYKELSTYGYNWEVQNGQPIVYSVLGWDYICIYRKPATNEGSMAVFYSAQATQLSDSEEPEIPSEYHDVLINYAVADMLDQNLEYRKSTQAYADYLQRLEDIKRYMNSRSLPDRLYSLKEFVEFGNANLER